MEKRKPVKIFTLQDHLDGKCDSNGIAYPGGARLIKPAEVKIIGEQPCPESPENPAETEPQSELGLPQAEPKVADENLQKAPTDGVNLDPIGKGPTRRKEPKPRVEKPDAPAPSTD